MSNILVIAPHPDDETFGCGGTILKHIKSGDKVYWAIVTSMKEELGFSKEIISRRESEIASVAQEYKFEKVFKLGFPTTLLDKIPITDLVKKLSECIVESKCDTMYVPNYGDIHSDHRAVSEAAISCTKWFRHEKIKKVYAYETLSETEFGINNSIGTFNPNVFVNIEEFLEKKLSIISIFKSEVGKAPFPRSLDVVKGLSVFRGGTSGYKNAEAFMLLKERLD
ncbi:PIG-L deacetylase family protein [Clostridium beijerinckii]|uniref:PIG-L deacetylase family protein n=1 Tax=Clostridium beijerinckii TaxID=1520 RepID=UPI0014942C95|nr:PIG-L deacetylase family protein [Clostridium beijerinckii]NOW04171.1 LmbE family N-acetylglucosaminyl deacetylase [Clostridium beijerinckii]NRT35113.1 LmbE family N-acetylglucosaminyl deacetylase [Clostridium beijerinckii]NRT45457.1 LmbE family N-acetylglucosaminyl deacetylase [Clostridium beijerinckii]NRZ20545.1 LmbE family N-acetylglucosaminyl deacetylase [Clostridium beijerinckii]NYC02688.1 LmbE family N-acetylglucosaminyl deacetylase [Clostridium beijerinckii]